MKKLNLNNYVITKVPEEASIEIIPHKLADGTQQPSMFWKSTRAERFKVTVDNMSVTEWHPKIIIDDTCNPGDYVKLVNWWFEKAQSNNDFTEVIESTFKNLPSLVDDIRASRRWLLTTGAFSMGVKGKPNKRKKEISKFMMSWLTRSMNKRTGSYHG